MLKKAYVKARLKFAIEHLDDPEEAWEKVMWSGSKRSILRSWSGLASLQT